MFEQLLHSRRSQARVLIWLVKAAAVVAIVSIGLFQFVLGEGFSVRELAPSYLSASLKFGRTEQGKFEWSLAIQPHGEAAPAPQGPVTDHVADNGPAPTKSVGTAPESIATPPIAALPVKAISTDREVSLPKPDDKALSCALPAVPKQASSDGRLILVSYPTYAGHVDGYGVNDTALSPSDSQAGYSLPVLQWFRHQGALAGYRQGAAAKAPRTRNMPLPNVLASSMDEGTGDYVMSIAHDAVDFITVGGGDFSSELNIWYHSLNAGFRTRIMGETPCAAAELPAMNGTRSNIQPVSISQNRRTMLSNEMTVSDRRATIHDFRVNGHEPSAEMGSEVRLPSSAGIAVSATLNISLDETPPQAREPRSGWNVEDARITGTRLVNVEAIVNGRVAASQTITADGTEQKINFNLPIKQSSWVAIRVKGAAHTNPVFVLVDNMPVRASRASVEWIMRSLLEAYETVNPKWNEKESASAHAAYEYSYAIYQRILSETTAP